MDRLLCAYQQSRYFCGGNAGVGCHEPDTGNQPVCHRCLTVCGKSLGIGAQNAFLLVGENPAAAGIGMVGIPAFKHEARKPFPQLLLQRNQQFVHGKHGIVRFVTGVNCGNLFVPDQQKRI